MPWGATIWVALCPELGYSVPNTAAAENTYVFPTLIGANSFTMRKAPIMQTIRSADGGNRRKFRVGSRHVYQGALNTLLHPDQGSFWATAMQTTGTGLATGQATIAGGSVTGVTIGGAGAGYPTSTTIPVSFFGGGGSGAYGFATAIAGAVTSVTMTGGSGGSGYVSPPGVQIGGMPSYTILFWDGVQLWQFNGACVQSFAITATAGQDYTTLTTNWIAQQRVAPVTMVNHAWPLATYYSTLNPYMFVETNGLCTLTGYYSGSGSQVVPLTNYRQMGFTVNNILQGTWDEQHYITSLLYCGRDLNFSIGPQYLGQAYPTSGNTSSFPPKPLRQVYEDSTPVTFQLEFSRSSPAHTFIINAQTNSYISNVADDMPLDNASYQNLSMEAFIDSTTALGSDFTVTAT